MGRPKRKTTQVATPPVAKKAQKRKAWDVKVKPDPDADKPSTSADSDKDKKVVTFTGTIPVDSECPLNPKEYHVHIAGNDIYNAMLNQTNIGANNNKYYILQVLKHNNRSEFFSWFRWGRVGNIAGKQLIPNQEHKAIQLFRKKFQNKTGFVWVFRSGFIKTKGKYDMVEIDYGQDDTSSTVVDGPKKPKIEVESKLDKRIQDVMSLIFDQSEWEASIKEMKFDIQKAPLGKLTKSQITAGYQSLKKIESCIKKKKQTGTELADACSEFYTRVPHDFGMKVPPLIKTPQDIKEKLQLLEALEDLQIAISVVEKQDESKNKLDGYYDSLKCDLAPLEKTDSEYKEIAKYVKNTHASTHNQYELAVQEVFRVNRDSDTQKFQKNLGSRMLLWHGSRLTNWCGILKQGLRIAPPEAPVTGYMFGKGVYFADMVSKSANYCFTNARQPIGFLLVCEVALGSMNEKIHSDYNADKLPKGKHSTKGCGRTAPDPKSYVKLEDGAVIPSGKPKPVKLKDGGYLMYNEYIVYNTAQIKPRYLVKTKFRY